MKRLLTALTCAVLALAAESASALEAADRETYQQIRRLSCRSLAHERARTERLEQLLAFVEPAEWPSLAPTLVGMGVEPEATRSQAHALIVERIAFVRLAQIQRGCIAKTTRWSETIASRHAPEQTGGGGYRAARPRSTLPIAIKSPPSVGFIEVPEIDAGAGGAALAALAAGVLIARERRRRAANAKQRAR